MAFKYNPLSGQIEDQQQGPQGPAGTMTSSAGGTASTPGFNFSGDTDTGLYSAGVNSVGIATGGANRLFIDSSGNVGIGTNSPNSILHIGAADNTNHEAILTLNNGGASGQEAGIEWLYEASTTPRAKIHLDSSQQSLTFSTANLTALIIDSSQKVGIGTTSPKANLHIKSGSNAWSQGLLLEDSTGNDGWNFYPDPDSGGELFIGYNDDLSGSPDSASTVFKLKASDKTAYFYGKVGIGTTLSTTPSSILSVEPLNTSSGRNISLYTKGSTGNKAGIFFNATQGTGNLAEIQAEYTGTNQGKLSFNTSMSPRMLIDASGKVGIGTTSPNALFTVKGASNGQLEFQPDNENSVNKILSINRVANAYREIHYDASSHNFEISGTSKLELTSTGNVLVKSGKVGIGTDDPYLDKVTIKNNKASGQHNWALHLLNQTHASDARIGIAFQGQGASNNTSSTWDGSGIYGANDGATGACHTVFGTVSDTVFSEKMRIKADGKIGIGTGTPDTLLHISQANVGAPQNAGSGLMIEHSTSADLQFMSGGGGYNHIFFGDADDANIGLIRYNHAGNANSMDFITNASAAPNLQIASSGKVSIGDAATHTYSAHTEGDDLVIGGAGWRGMTIYGTNGGVIQFADDAGNRDGQIIYDHGNRSMHFRSAGNVDRLKIDSSGNVGIGTNGPNRLLHIAGSGTANLIRVGRTDSSSHGSHDVQVQFAENHYHNLKVGAETYSLSTRSTANALFINDAGNVGIGTTSPTHKLEVNGTSRFNNYIEFGGTVSTPSTAAAIYRPADNSLAFSTANTQRLLLDSYGAATFQGDINIGAEKYLKFGGTALQIRRSSGNNYINSGSGSLYLQAGGSSAFEISSIGDITFFGNSSKDVIWDKSEGLLRLKDNAKLEFGTDADTQIWHDDSELSIYNGTGTIRTRSDSLLVRNKANNASLLECYSDRAEFPGDIKLAATKGIQFGTTAGANHTLDDYEEGNHNPTDESDVSPALSFTYNNIGIYTKIGGFVHFSFDITFPSSISTAKGAEHAKISAPYLAQQDNHGGGCVGFTDIGKAVLLHVNTSGVFLREDGGSNLTNAQCAGKRFIGQVVFRAT